MANTGDIPNNITLGASQTMRRNASNTGFEAFIPQTSFGNGSAQYQYIVTGATPFAPGYSVGYLNITAAKTLTVGADTTITGLLTINALGSPNSSTLNFTGLAPATWVLNGTGGTLQMNGATLNVSSGGTLALGSYTLTVPATGTAALLGVANVFTQDQTISSTAPAIILTDTTASAKSLTVVVDANAANFRESAGAASSLLVLDLANNRVGIGVAPSSIFEVQGTSPNPIFRTASTGQSMTLSFYETSTLKGRLLYAGGNPASFKYFGFINDAADYLVFYTLNNTPIYFYPNNALSVTFEAGGNVALVNKITTYNNVATEGYGVGAIVDDVALTNQGADIGSTNFTNAGTAGTYLLSIYFVVTTLDAAAGTVTLNFAWNDGGARALGLSTLVLTSTGYFSQTLPVKLSTGSISYNTTHTGSYGTAKYALYMSCIRLS